MTVYAMDSPKTTQRPSSASLRPPILPPPPLHVPANPNPSIDSGFIDSSNTKKIPDKKNPFLHTQKHDMKITKAKLANKSRFQKRRVISKFLGRPQTVDGMASTFLRLNSKSLCGSLRPSSIPITKLTAQTPPLSTKFTSSVISAPYDPKTDRIFRSTSSTSIHADFADTMRELRRQKPTPDFSRRITNMFSPEAIKKRTEDASRKRQTLVKKRRTSTLFFSDSSAKLASFRQELDMDLDESEAENNDSDEYEHVDQLPDVNLAMHKKKTSLAAQLRDRQLRPFKMANSDWMTTYRSDLNDFNSLSVHASVKLREARHLANSGSITQSAVLAFACYHLISELPRLRRSSPAMDLVVENILLGVYQYEPEYENFSSNDDVDHRHQVADKNKSILSLSLNQLMKLPTYYDSAGNLLTRLKKELQLRPPLLDRMNEIIADQQLVVRVIERAARIWSGHILRHVLNRWRTVKDSEHTRMLLGKYLIFMKGVRPSVVFALWKKWWMQERVAREKGNFKDFSVTKNKLIAQNKERTRNIANLCKMTKVMSSGIEKLRREIAKQRVILNEPARQTPTLKKILKCFGSALRAVESALKSTTKDGIANIVVVGEENVRLAPLHRYNSTTTERLKFNEFEAEDAYDENIEREIHFFRPGKLKSKEYTRAFDPFNTRSGRIIKRFVNFCIMEEKFCQYEGTFTKNVDKVFYYDPKSHALPFVETSDLALIEPYISVMNYVSFATYREKAKKAKYHEVKPIGTGSHSVCRGLPTEFIERHPNVKLAEILLLHLKYRTDPSVGRYLNLANLTHLDIPKTMQTIKRDQIKMAAKKKQEEMKGVIVHEMSQYFGQRVETLRNDDRFAFALFTEVMHAHYHKMGKVDGLDSYLRGLLDEMIQFSTGMMVNVGDCWLDLFEHSHLEIMRFSKEIVKNFSMMLNSCGLITKAVEFGIQDRANYRRFVHDAMFVNWQSMCTTVLAIRVRTETDIDDGSYTTIRKCQVEQDLKRLGIIDEGEQKAVLQELSDILKGRIRDFKRIFTFYAAVSDLGSIAELDHSEAWKFVKDCKLQRDRKLMPSVRVDLTFQSCQLDYSLTGKERMNSQKAELGSVEFVEFVAKLATYRYTRGTWGTRLKKMIEEDILPNACTINVDIFRERLAGGTVKNVCRKHRHNMQIIYKDYAAEDTATSEAMDNLDSMNVNELVVFAREFKLVGPLLSERAIKVLFAYVQHDEETLLMKEDNAGTKGSDKIEGDDSEMVFGEFYEAVAAIGSQMHPDPYCVLDIRIDNFLKDTLIPRAFTMKRFKKQGLKKITGGDDGGGDSEDDDDSSVQSGQNGGASRIGASEASSTAERKRKDEAAIDRIVQGST